MFFRIMLVIVFLSLLSCAVSVNNSGENSKYDTYIKVNTISGDLTNVFEFSVSLIPKSYVENEGVPQINEYRWDFDCDGRIDSISQVSNISYTYQKEGIYEPCVTVVGKFKEADNKYSDLEIFIYKYFDFSKIYVTKKIETIEVENSIENLRAGITSEAYLKISCLDKDGEPIPYAGLSFLGDEGTSFYEDDNGQLIEITNTNMNSDGTKEIYVSGKTSLLNDNGSINSRNLIKIISNSKNKIEEELDLDVRGGVVSSIEEITLGGEFQHIPAQSDSDIAPEINNFGIVELILKDIYGNPVANEEVELKLLGTDSEAFNKDWEIACTTCQSATSVRVKSDETGKITFEIFKNQDFSVGQAKVEVSFDEIIFSFEVSIGVYNGEPDLVFMVEDSEISEIILEAENSSTTKTITIQNVGSATAELTQISNLVAPFSYKDEIGSCLRLSDLAPEATCELTIEFNPTSDSIFNSDIYINYRKFNDSISKLSRLRLSGAIQ